MRSDAARRNPASCHGANASVSRREVLVENHAQKIDMQAVVFGDYGAPDMIWLDTVAKPVPDDHGHARGKVVITV